MEPKELEIHTTEKNGTQYKNLVLKPTKKQLAAGMTGLEPNEYIIVEKVFPEGYENTNVYDGKTLKSYSCRVKYNDEEVSFWLNESQHEAYKVLGEVGSKIKITGVLNKNSKTGTYYLDFQFDPVN